MKKQLNRIIREDNFLSLAGNLIIAVLGIAGFAILARSLSAGMFGQWVLLITAASFIEMFRFGLTGTGLIRFLSGANDTMRIQLQGSNALIGLVATIIIAGIIAICNYCFYQPIQSSGYGLFFTWYPLLAFLNLPWNNALLALQANRSYGKMLVVKLINSGTFFIVLLLHVCFLQMSLQEIVIAYHIINAVTSVVCIVAGWDGLQYLTKANRLTTSSLLHFGKHTTLTLAGTNLLRSADTLIISVSPMGSAAVALYSIPLKLTELQQIPLRSFTATAFPKMSKASLQGKTAEVKSLFYTYAGALSYLFVLISLITFLFADQFVFFIGGQQYLQSDPLTGCNAADIVRVFSLYGLLLPIDRMTGIGLDSINKPAINALKVFLMVLANITGDLLSLFVFKSLLLVALSSVLFTLLGIWIGMIFLNRELSLQYREIFTAGVRFYKSLFNKFTGYCFHKKLIHTGK